MLSTYIFIFFVASYQTTAKNWTKCVPGVCGPNADCLDDENDPKFKMYGEPYCQCFLTSVENPPYCKSLCSKECINSNEYCDPIDDACKIGCRSHKNCEFDEYCSIVNGKCIKGCRSDVYCKLGEYCDLITRKCTDNCNSHDDCRTDEYCHSTDKSCKNGCRSHEFCLLDEFCNHASKCEKGCRSDEDCIMHKYCDIYNTCVEGCRNNSNCNTNEFCNFSNKCEMLCTESSECGENTECSVINHKKYCSCSEGFAPEPSIGKIECKSNEGEFVIPLKDGQIDCTFLCGVNSNCESINSTIYCFCDGEESAGNPFEGCYKPYIPPGPPLSPGGLIPGGEVPISEASIKALING